MKMNGEKIKNWWGADRLHKFSALSVENASISDEDKTFLIEVGLPILKGTDYDSFYQSIHNPVPIEDYYRLLRPAFFTPSEIKDCLVIASDDLTESSISIKSTGRDVIYFLPEEPWQKINSSIEKFCLFLTCINEFGSSFEEIEPENMKNEISELKGRLLEIDSAAFSSESDYWQPLIDDLTFGMF